MMLKEENRLRVLQKKVIEPKKYISFFDHIKSGIFKCEKDNFLSPFIFNEISPIEIKNDIVIINDNEAQGKKEEENKKEEEEKKKDK